LFYEFCSRVCPEVFDDPVYRLSEAKFSRLATDEFNAARDLGLIDNVTASNLWAKLIPLFYTINDSVPLRDWSLVDKYQWYQSNLPAADQF
jgi:hypothetical protein